MRTAITFTLALVIAAAAFVFIMVTKPPVSEARITSSIDPHSLTIKSDSLSEVNYDCN